MRETRLLLLLTGAVFGAVLIAALIWGQRRPAGAVSLEARLPTPQTWTHISSARADDAVPSLMSEFRAVTLESPERIEPGSTDALIEISLPVTAQDCAALGSRLGGGCSGAGEPLQQPEMISIQSLGSPLQIVMHLKGRGSFDLSHAGSSGDLQPTEWTLVQRAPVALLEINCQPGDRLLLAGPDGSADTTCRRFGSEYSLRAAIDRRSSPHLHLNGVHWLKARLLGETGIATIEEGEMILNGRVEPVNSPEPEEIKIQADAPHLITLDVNVPRPEAPPHFSLRTSQAATATGAGHQLPTWMEMHPEIAYLVIGALAGSFLTALFDHLVARWR